MRRCIHQRSSETIQQGRQSLQGPLLCPRISGNRFDTIHIVLFGWVLRAAATPHSWENGLDALERCLEDAVAASP